MASKREIIDILKLLRGVYSQEPENVDAYLFTLEEYTTKQLESAVKAHIKESKWYPKPSEIVAQAEKIKSDEWDPNADRTILYWQAMESFFSPMRHTNKSWLWYCNQARTPEDKAWAAMAKLSDAEWEKVYVPPIMPEYTWDEEKGEWIDGRENNSGEDIRPDLTESEDSGATGNESAVSAHADQPVDHDDRLAGAADRIAGVSNSLARGFSAKAYRRKRQAKAGNS